MEYYYHDAAMTVTDIQKLLDEKSNEGWKILSFSSLNDLPNRAYRSVCICFERKKS